MSDTKYRDFMKLPLEERRRLMSESAEKYVVYDLAEKCYDSFPKFPFLNQVNRPECVEKIAEAIQRSNARLKEVCTCPMDGNGAITIDGRHSCGRIYIWSGVKGLEQWKEREAELLAHLELCRKALKNVDETILFARDSVTRHLIKEALTVTQQTKENPDAV